MKTRIPKIEFTKWEHWKDRLSLIKGTNCPGVYLLAQFKTKPARKINPNSKAIIYIGETCASLKRRWRQFDRAAFHGEHGHSGGLTYREIYGDNGKRLYVSVFPVRYSNIKLRSLFIRYVERKLIWEFAKKWGCAPKCNRK